MAQVARPGSLALASLREPPAPTLSAPRHRRPRAGSSRRCRRPPTDLRSPRRPQPMRRGDPAFERADAMTELEFKSLALPGLQPHSADRRGVRRPRDAAVAVPEAGPRRAASGKLQLPARIGGRRRALRPLLVHRPAGAHAAARDRLSHRGRDRRRGRRDARRQSARLHRRLPAALQGRAAARACRASAAASPATSATTRCATSSRKLAKTLRRPAASTRPTSCCCSARSSPSSTTCRAGST